MTYLDENEDKLVEKISCYQALEESEMYEKARELTSEEQEHLQWFIVMLDIKVIDGGFQIKNDENKKTNFVLEELYKSRDWSQGPNTDLTLRYSDKTEVEYEFQQAEYHWKDGGLVVF